MKVEVNYDYWDTLYEYLDKEEFKLNDNIVHDAKIIKRVQYLWRNASEEYLKNVEAKYLTKVWTNIDSVMELTTYKNAYKTFIYYLFYATDRMNPNRWLYLQMCINRASDFVSKKYKGNDWTNEVCDGYCEDSGYFYNIERDCEIE